MLEAISPRAFPASATPLTLVLSTSFVILAKSLIPVPNIDNSYINLAIPIVPNIPATELSTPPTVISPRVPINIAIFFNNVPSNDITLSINGCKFFINLDKLVAIIGNPVEAPPINPPTNPPIKLPIKLPIAAAIADPLLIVSASSGHFSAAFPYTLNTAANSAIITPTANTPAIANSNCFGLAHCASTFINTATNPTAVITFNNESGSILPNPCAIPSNNFPNISNITSKNAGI